MFVFLRFKRWLRGVGHLRGFGVQSPFAYSLLRDVFREKAPYYKYVEFDKTFPNLSHQYRKQARLLFRLANELQAATFYVDTHLDNSFSAFIHSGALRSIPVDNPTEATLCVLSMDSDSYLEEFVEKANDSDVLVLCDIYSNGRQKEAWKRLLSSEKVTVTFDFYSFGIVFFQSSLHRVNYILNF